MQRNIPLSGPPSGVTVPPKLVSRKAPGLGTVWEWERAEGNPAWRWYIHVAARVLTLLFYLVWCAVWGFAMVTGVAFALNQWEFLFQTLDLMNLPPELLLRQEAAVVFSPLPLTLIILFGIMVWSIACLMAGHMLGILLHAPPCCSVDGSRWQGAKLVGHGAVASAGGTGPHA